MKTGTKRRRERRAGRVAWDGDAFASVLAEKGYRDSSLASVLTARGWPVGRQNVRQWRLGAEPGRYPLVAEIARVLGVRASVFFAPTTDGGNDDSE